MLLLLEKLTELGVLRHVAEQLVAQFPERVPVQLRALWAKRKKPANPAGYIVDAIRENYPLPVDLLRIPETHRVQVSLTQLDAAEIMRREDEARAKRRIEAEQQRAADEALIASLPADMREQFELTARRKFAFMHGSRAFDGAIRQAIVDQAKAAQLGGAR